MILDKILRNLRKKQIIKYIGHGTILCDIGCGFEGKLLQDLRSSITYGYGFDKQVKMINDGKIKLDAADFERDSLNLPDASVDAVTMLAVIEHLEGPNNILKEIFRILKPGGKFILTTPSPAGKPVLEFLAFKLKIINQEDIVDHKRYYSKEELGGVLAGAGFDPKNIKMKYFESGFNIFAKAVKNL